jgi:hypothetical protein
MALVTLHYASDDSEVLVNPDQVQLVNNISIDGYTTIWLVDNTHFSVRENISQVREAVHKATR